MPLNLILAHPRRTGAWASQLSLKFSPDWDALPLAHVSADRHGQARAPAHPARTSPSSFHAGYFPRSTSTAPARCDTDARPPYDGHRRTDVHAKLPVWGPSPGNSRAPPPNKRCSGACVAHSAPRCFGCALCCRTRHAARSQSEDRADDRIRCGCAQHQAARHAREADGRRSSALGPGGMRGLGRRTLFCAYSLSASGRVPWGTLDDDIALVLFVLLEWAVGIPSALNDSPCVARRMTCARSVAGGARGRWLVHKQVCARIAWVCMCSRSVLRE
ncbi:hypothetical protein BC834DRAFT_872271 [Gloeopeniophorella convolvens]|nr:hypothetical protein BC834DRAFT_872271 [Gloeopeniophorella convolvens]